MAEEREKLNIENCSIVDDRGNFSHLELQKSWLKVINEINLMNEKLDFIYGKLVEKDILPPPQG